jgi:transposase InsO family protein
MGTSGSEGGQQKPTSRKTGRALLSDPYTYLATGEGWLYLCAVRDGCSRRVLGWSVQDHLRADLVDRALTMAIVLRGTLPAKVIFHSDSEYGGAGVPGFLDSQADGPVRRLVSRLPRAS